MFRFCVPCVLSVIVLQLGGAQPAEADSYRCGRKLVRTGDSSAAVLRVCGEPRFKDRGHERVVLDGGSKLLPVERWHYKRSRRSLEHVVMLYRGRVIAISVGGR